MTRILIADEDQEVRSTVKHHLTVAGYRVVEAQSAQAALEAIAETKIELLLTETNLSDMDGRTVLSPLRARGQEVPVIFLTATLDTNMVAECMQHGLSDFILKPIKPEEVVSKIEKVLGPLPAVPESRGYDILLVDDMEKVQTALENAVSDDFSIFGATSGAKALELAGERTFPLIIVDMVMPEEEPATITRDLRAKLPYARMVALYSRKVRYPGIRAQEAGYDGFLVKPFVEAQLKALLAPEEEAAPNEVATLSDGLLRAAVQGERAEEVYLEELTVQIHDAVEQLAADCCDEVILDLRNVPAADGMAKILEDTLQQCMDSCIEPKVISGATLEGRVPESVPNYSCLSELLDAS